MLLDKRRSPILANAMEMLLTVEQVAQRLQLHPETIRRQLNSGVLRGIKRGRTWRVPESALTEPAPKSATAKEFSREEAKAKGYGFLKGKIRSSDEFLAERRAEAEREKAKDEARHKVSA